MEIPTPRHGYICGNVLHHLHLYLERHDLGCVVSNHSGVVTERDPDTVRGADISFYSYDRVPKGPLPPGYLTVVPELVWEVRSPSDRWSLILRKVAEYLDAGVLVVCVLDPQTETAHLYYPDQPSQILTADQELTLPTILPGFRVMVRRFFE
jgi:Uma2 family endonuclease